MLKIGICDDDFAFGCQVEEYLNHYAQKENMVMEVKVFLSGEEYLNYLKAKAALDILFLGIENFVSEFRVDEVVLASGDVLPISRAKQKNIQEKLLNLKIAGRNRNDNL